MQESIVFLVRVQCRRKESSRALSHLLMSFLFIFISFHFTEMKGRNYTMSQGRQLLESSSCREGVDG